YGDMETRCLSHLLFTWETLLCITQPLSSTELSPSPLPLPFTPPPAPTCS
ncbi:unnamed protein product, partial [Candidula unifasciata]